VGIAVEPDHQEPLPRVAGWIGVLEHIEKFPGFDRNHNRFEAEIPLSHELLILLKAPSKRLHLASLIRSCA
jgi:hypothetical protein